MATNIVTTEDLQAFKLELLDEIKKLLSKGQPAPAQRWLKSHQIRKLLNISPGKLYSLRESGILPYSKIGSVLLYDYYDIEKMLQKSKHGRNSSNKETQPTTL